MTNVPHLRVSFALLFALVLAACGTTREYQAPVKSFAVATGAAQQSLDQYLTAFSSQIKEVQIKAAVERPVRAQVERGDCLVDSERCRVMFRMSRDDPPTSLSSDESFENISALLTEVKNYADGLNSIATSDSDEQAEAALASTKGNLENLAKLVAGEGAGAADFAEPVAAAAAWAASEYIDQVRLDALREATAEADPLVGRANVLFEGVSRRVSEAARADLANEVTAREVVWRGEGGQAALTNLLTAATAYDAVLQTPPEAVFHELRQSHAALTQALNSREISLASVYARMDSLKAEAEKLKKVVTAFIAASKKE